MTRAHAHPQRLAAVAGATVAAIGLMAAPALAGTRADVFTHTTDAFVRASSNEPGKVTLHCGGDRQVIDRSSVVQSVDNGGSVDDVTVTSTPQGEHAVAYEVTVAAAPAVPAWPPADEPHDNADVEDPQPTDGKRTAAVKVFATCLGEKTSDGDRLDIDDTFGFDNGKPPYGLGNAYAFLPKYAVRGDKHRRLVYNDDTGPIVEDSTAALDPGETKTVVLRCGRNTFGEFALVGDEKLGGGRRLLGSEPLNDGWRFIVRNDANAAQPIANWKLTLICIQQKTAKQRLHA